MASDLTEAAERRLREIVDKGCNTITPADRAAIRATLSALEGARRDQKTLNTLIKEIGETFGPYFKAHPELTAEADVIHLCRLRAEAAEALAKKALDLLTGPLTEDKEWWDECHALLSSPEAQRVRGKR